MLGCEIRFGVRLAPTDVVVVVDVVVDVTVSLVVVVDREPTAYRALLLLILRPRGRSGTGAEAVLSTASHRLEVAATAGASSLATNSLLRPVV